MVSLNCGHHYPFRLSTKKITRDMFAFTELLSVSRKSTELEQYFICCRRPVNSSFQVSLQLAKTDKLTVQNILTLRARDSFKWASRYLYQFTEYLASNEIRWPYIVNRRGYQISHKNYIGFLNTIMKLRGLDGGDLTWLATTSTMDIQSGARNVIPLIVQVTHFYYYKNI